jgi:type IV secretory pathway VirB2 component (pilin)
MRIRPWIERISYATLSLSVWLTATNAFAAAAGGTLPWDTPLQTIVTDATGPTAHGITTVAAVLGGLAWAHSEHGAGIRKLSAVGFGSVIGLGATQLINTVFPFAGALI